MLSQRDIRISINGQTILHKEICIHLRIFGSDRAAGESFDGVWYRNKVEYGGLKTGDYKIDAEIIIEIGGASKGMSQISEEDKARSALAVDDIDMALGNKIPLWAFGFLY